MEGAEEEGAKSRTRTMAHLTSPHEALLGVTLVAFSASKLCRCP